MAVKEFLEGTLGKALGVGFAVLAVGVMLWLVLSGDGMSAIAADTSARVFIDEDGNTERRAIEIGQTNDFKGPTGKPMFPAEVCYWTKDGKPKTDPTFVLLNEYINKPGPTFCPDCDRLVRGLNPAPDPKNLRPPPTKADWNSRGK